MVRVKAYTRPSYKQIAMRNPLLAKEFRHAMQGFPLPSKGDIPKVSQEDLLNLYKNYASGIKDEQLLAEVESRLIARMEMFVMLNEPFSTGDYSEPGKSLSASTFGEIRRLADYYELSTSGWPIAVSEALGLLKDSRRSGFDARMLAVDRAIHVYHDRGGLAGNFIASDPLEPLEFLDYLAGRRNVRQEKIPPGWPRHSDVSLDIVGGILRSKH